MADLLPEAKDVTVSHQTNASPDRFDMVAKTTPAGSTRETVMPLSVAYPQEVYSRHMLLFRSRLMTICMAAILR